MKPTRETPRRSALAASIAIAVGALLAGCGGSQPDVTAVEIQTAPQAAAPGAGKVRAGAATTQDVIDRAVAAQANAQAAATTR